MIKTLPKHAVLLQAKFDSVVEWYLFQNPVKVLCAQKLEDVNTCLKNAEQYQREGFYVVGYVAYEAASGINPVLKTNTQKEYPLVWFGVYSAPVAFDIESLAGHLDKDSVVTGEGQAERIPTLPENWKPSLEKTAYFNHMADIKNAIAQGDTYQVNYTYRLKKQFAATPLSFFYDLAKKQSSNYCAYMNLDRWHICSASPELFFTFKNKKLTAKPMKGTALREAGVEAKKWLENSEKNKAENIMIVDMLRNDMGTLANTGSVKVETLCEVEEYPTVYQMTSTITATTENSAVDVFKTMFPCASVTGAPKIKTMEIIKKLESSPRGIYTGSIGVFSPGNNAQFNVAIRTAVVDTKENSVEYGVGSGVTWESNAEEEWLECLAKAAVLKG